MQQTDPTAETTLAAGSGIAVVPAIAVTCMDQIDGTTRCRHNGTDHECTWDDPAAHVAQAFGMPVRYIGYGPTRAEILAV